MTKTPVGLAHDAPDDRSEIRRQQALWGDVTAHPVEFFTNRDPASRPVFGDIPSAGSTTWAWAIALRRHEAWLREGRHQPHIHYSIEHPLPVGRQSLREYMEWIEESGRSRHYGTPEFLLDLMPFQGDELAACIIRVTIQATTIEAFGLCRTEATESDDALHYRIDDMKFRLIGPNPSHHKVVSLCRELRKWWATLSGEVFQRSRGGGRPPVDLDEEAAIDAWLELYWSSGGFDSATRRYEPFQPPTSGEVMKRLREQGLRFSKATFYDRQKQWEQYPPEPPETPD